MSEDRPTDETPETIATQEPPASDPVAPEPPEPVAAEAPVTANGTPPADEAPPPATPEVTAPEPEVTAPASPKGPAPDAPDALAPDTPEAAAPASAPPEAPAPAPDAAEGAVPEAPPIGTAPAAQAPAQDAPAPAAPAPAAETPAQDAPAPVAPAPPRAKRPPRPREPLPWPELRAAATSISEGAGVEALKDLFRLLPDDIRDETVEAVREYRKGARRPVSAFAGKSLARAVHTARRARRRPDSDAAVSEALGQALAAEVIASLDVEIAAEVILPKRDLLERESKNARRRQKAEDDRARDEKRRKAREEGGAQGGNFGTYSGAKIRGLDELAKLFEEQESKTD